MDEKLPGRNKFVRWFGPGMWLDGDGNAHLDIYEIHKLEGIPTTPEEIEESVKIVQQLLIDKGLAGVKFIIRRTPED